METGLRRLRYFRTLAASLNFRRAAQSLHITQPALSRAIQRLEEDVGVRLLERSNTQVSLTRAGVTFAAECDRVLSALAHAVEETRRVSRGEVGSVAVGYTDTAIAGAMPDIVETFRHREPGVTVLLFQVPTNMQVQMLRNGQIDIGLCTGPSDRKEFEAVAVQRDSLVALVPKTHPLAGQASISLRDLAEEAFVLGDLVAWAVYNRHLMRACENAGFQPKIVQTAPEVRAIVGLVSCGLGVTVMPESHATALDSRTVALRIRDRTDPLITEAVWIEKSSHPAMARFVAHVRRYELRP